MTNRLTASTSPYLRQHADNPVDWWEWGDDAFAEARRRDVPLLVSVGYAACHWCHVMAHESFEDDATAAFMNAHFVNVKVDREERPDVDAVYMAATQALTGQGGWPMTVFTTPEGTPFFCGTYFPPRPVHGVPSFPEVLAGIAAAWQTRRDEVDATATTIRDAFAAPRSGPAPDATAPHVNGDPRATVDHGAPLVAAPATVVDDALLDRALGRLLVSQDRVHGGFGGAPKFPPSTVLEWLLRRHARTGDARTLEVAEHTLEAMARGGIHDQLGGGFARYAVDATWTVPHFEKMLYDNALLLRVYAHWWRSTGSPLAHRVVTGTADWLLRDLRTAEGGFASSLDADTEGTEGATYVWTPAELRAVLGDDDAAWAAALLDVTDAGTFEHGTSVPTLRTDPDDEDRAASVRARLLAHRATRAQPGRDDKVVSAWNGLAVAALAEAGALLDRPDWVDAAVAAATLLVDRHVRPDRSASDATTSGSVPTDHEPADVPLRLVRASRDGIAGAAAGVLEDYADVAEGLLALAAVTGDGRWVRHAGGLLRTVLDRFPDGDGGFYDTADDETDPVLARLRRPHDPADGPTPSGQAAAAGALLTYAALTGSTRHREAAERALAEPLRIAVQHPRAAGWALAVAEALLDGPREVAVVGRADDDGTRALHRVALRSPAPGLVVAVGPPAAPPDARPADGGTSAPAGAGAPDLDLVVPLLRDRPLVDGRPAAYVCRGFVCDRPTTSPEDLAAVLGTR
ncbi:thioredoxin domain-containing protein [Cellulomonas sp. H30R-01]|uniref:thioredoxin domain-containing protein n=1 Tax=Cellulomonas sp. H30R-01 TaxID=2704467 RepID=UPI00138CCDF5|nr:thioredoxin domain-containing protein [Cellulomonas sp. H30R-01]QHT57365.1 thioredoxin domain-containing protein [Cellulomonas sp. H30R-01]